MSFGSSGLMGMIWWLFTLSFPDTSECLLARLALVCVVLIWSSQSWAGYFPRARWRKKPYVLWQCVPLCSSKALVDWGRVNNDTSGFRKAVPSGGGSPSARNGVHAGVECDAGAREWARKGSVRKSFFGLVRGPTVRLDFGCVSRLNRFVVVAASRTSFLEWQRLKHLLLPKEVLDFLGISVDNILGINKLLCAWMFVN